MNPLTCREAEESLELFALGECPRPLADAVAAHVADCPACRRSLTRVRQLLGLIDLHYQEPERLRRLFDRLGAEDRPGMLRKRVLHFPRQLASLAALLLIALGLGWLAPVGTETVFGPLAEGRPSARDGVGFSGLPEVMQAKKGARATVWTSPRADGLAVAGDGVRLDSGTLWVLVEPTPGRPPFVVETARGVIATGGGRLVIEAGRAADVVTVVEGEVEWRNGRGSARGRAGDVLWAEGDGPSRQRGGRDSPP